MWQPDIFTARLTLGLVSFTALAVLFLLWRINRGMPGLLLWVLCAALSTINYLQPPSSYWPNPALPLIVNTTNTQVALLLIFEGLCRFRGFGFARQRLWVICGLLLAFFVSSILFVDVLWLRAVIHDGIAALLLLATIVALLWRTSGLERQVHGVVAIFFVALAVAFALRAAEAWQVGSQYVPIKAVFLPWLYLTAVIWSMGWSFGFSAMVNLRVQQALAALAWKDPLTGLANRRAFAERAHEALAAAKRRGHAVGLLLVDLDDFKHLNDQHGHAAGDLLLQAVANRLQGFCRADEAAARLGGDEFVVLLPHVGDAAELEGASQRLRTLLDGVVSLGASTYPLSASIGAALVGPDMSDGVDILLHEADVAMYRAKQHRKSALA